MTWFRSMPIITVESFIWENVIESWMVQSCKLENHWIVCTPYGSPNCLLIDNNNNKNSMLHRRSWHGLTQDWTGFYIAIFRMSTPFITVLDKSRRCNTFFCQKYKIPSLASAKYNHVLRMIRGTQREYSSKPLKHSIVEYILVFKR